MSKTNVSVSGYTTDFGQSFNTMAKVDPRVQVVLLPVIDVISVIRRVR